MLARLAGRGGAVRAQGTEPLVRATAGGVNFWMPKRGRDSVESAAVNPGPLYSPGKVRIEHCAGQRNGRWSASDCPRRLQLTYNPGSPCDFVPRQPEHHVPNRGHWGSKEPAACYPEAFSDETK
jgi:hypothetical protein